MSSPSSRIVDPSVRAGRHRKGLGALLGSLTVAVLLTACSGEAPPQPSSETPAADAPAAESTPTAEAPATDPVELEYWKTIKDSEHTEDFWSYLEKYPNGAFADLAKSRIERLSAGDDKADDKASAKSETTQTRSGGDIRTQRRDVVLSAIRSELRGFSDRRLHVGNDIPRFKLDNVAELHGLDPRRVLLLYDDGSGGGGKTGFCLTDRRMYWRFVAGSDNFFLDYEDIGPVRAGRTSFSVNGYDVPTSLAGNSAEAAERFADLIERIARDMQRR